MRVTRYLPPSHTGCLTIMPTPITAWFCR
ncbi:hypothetical protein KIPB_010902, partial [Kipferlia bialata]|eukprot:g10902.t1